MDKEAIIKNFSRYAYLYDKYADVQRKAALWLAKEIKGNDFSNILEIGCGTGNYTFILRRKFQDAKITAIDISKKMLEVAQEKLKDSGIEFVAEDGENVCLDEKFDLLTSNACFQWFQDLEGALCKYKDLLKKNGIILFSVFGPSTFWELNISLEKISKNISVCACNFMTKERIGKILRKNFKEIKIKEASYSEYFPHLKGLLDKIKYSGIKGEGLNGRIYFSRRLLNELEKTYWDKFSAVNDGAKQIKATYQVFFCSGLRP